MCGVSVCRQDTIIAPVNHIFYKKKSNKSKLTGTKRLIQVPHAFALPTASPSAASLGILSHLKQRTSSLLVSNSYEFRVHASDAAVAVMILVHDPGTRHWAWRSQRVRPTPYRPAV